MATIAPEELVERIWERDPTVWTGADEAQWLGWLDEPLRSAERAPVLAAFAEEAIDEFAEAVLLGVGGAAVPADVLRRAFLVESFHVLDTPHPRAIRALEDRLDVERTLFLASSKSGAALETLSLLEYFWERTGRRAAQFAVVTDPGSPFDDLARERGFRAVFHGEPTVGGAFGALSASGMVPAALMGIDLDGILDGAAAMALRCRSDDANAGLALGAELVAGAREGRDKVAVAGELSQWVEHVLADATGKDGQGLVPAPD